MSIHLYHNDIPSDFQLKGDLAIDTETMGLNILRDRLCLMQISNGDGEAHLVQFEDGAYDAPNLKAFLQNPEQAKIFHFARFDVAVIEHYLGVVCDPIYCTKIASKLARTYTDRHGLKDLTRELLGVELSKQQQSSHWGSAELSENQLKYAASDVLYLHDLRAKLQGMLEETGRTALAQACFDFLPMRGKLDLNGWAETDIFAHS